MHAGEQTRLGRFFDRRPLLLRSLAIGALLWGVAYLTWRIGWSGEGASPLAFAMLLATEVYGIWALGTLTWFSWSRPPAVRPPATPGRTVDVYVCTYDEPTEVVAATLAGCRALAYPHVTYLLDDGRRPEMEELAKVAGARYLTRPDNAHAKAGNINAALPRTNGELVLMLDADPCRCPTPSTRWSATSTRSGSASCRARTTSSTTTRSSTTSSAATSSRSSTASSAPARTATAPPTGAARRR